MRYEVIDFYESKGFNIPMMIEKGRGHRWKVKPKQVEAACEFVYLQIQEKGLPVPVGGLGRYTLSIAHKMRLGRYYKINRGEPVLLDDLRAVRVLERNLANTNDMLEWTKGRLLLWKIIAYTVFVGLSFVIFKTNWYY